MNQRRRVTRDGYIEVHLPDHPVATTKGWAAEHRVVAWDTFGPFDLSMEVHHKNRRKDDNRPNNLQVLTVAEHRWLHGQIKRKVNVREAVALYEAGATTPALAKRYDTDQGTISRALRDAGAKMRTAAETVTAGDPSADEVWAAVREARSAADLSATLGVTRPVMRRLMRKYGVPAFPPGAPRTRHASGQLAGVS
jgi:hypothetical protein